MRTHRTAMTVTFATVAVLVIGACGDGRGAARGVAESCAFSYSPQTLRARSWAFDGTVKSTSTGHDSRLGAVPVTTFHINRWFKGGSGPFATVEFSLATSGDQQVNGGLGTRLLVTGEPRWGGRPLDDPVAWGCGFTQVWTRQTAQRWATAFSQ
jgi:hypothetical protein